MLGIFGGTFDPIHYGHLRTALELQQLFGLQELRLIPCAQPPHRDTPQVDSAQRLAMLELALSNCPGLVADGLELQRSGPSYTVDTLAELREIYSESPLVVLMGMDAFEGIARWYQWQRLFEFAHVVVITRPGFSLPPLLPELAFRLTDDRLTLRRHKAGALYFQPVTQLEISATAIRAQLANGQNPRFLLPDQVLDYIYQHGLYAAHAPTQRMT